MARLFGDSLYVVAKPFIRDHIFAKKNLQRIVQYVLHSICLKAIG